MMLRLRIPNSSSFRYKVLNAVLVGAFLAAPVAVGWAVLQHLGYFKLHPVLWGMAGAMVLLLCGGYVLIFGDEAFGKSKGQLLLSDDSIGINEDVFALSMIRKVVIVMQGYQGSVRGHEKGAYEASNVLTMHTFEQQQITCNFLLNSSADLGVLEELFTAWQIHGIKLRVYGLD